jgi:TonB family protein
MAAKAFCWTLPIVLGTSLLASGGRVPFPMRIVSLQYPTLGAEARISGTVVLRLRLDDAGRVSSVSTVSGHAVLVKAASQNIKLWRFSPAQSRRASGGPEFNFIYVFSLKGVSFVSHPCSAMTYEYPNKVVVTSEAPHWMP